MDKTQLKEFLEEHGKLRAPWSKNNKELHNEETLKWIPNPKEQPCEDCDQMVVDRIIEVKLINLGQPNQRYQRKCSECKQYLGRSKRLE